MNEPHRLDRREAIKWMLAATATVSLLNFRSFGAPAPEGEGEPLLRHARLGGGIDREQLRQLHRAVDDRRGSVGFGPGRDDSERGQLLRN